METNQCRMERMMRTFDRMGNATIKAVALTLFVGLMLSPGWTSAALAEAESSPNVVILFADDLGYGDLGSYGHPTIETPNLDRLANQGTRFKAFYTAAWCVPSRTQLLTGRYLSQVNLNGRTGADGNGHLPEKLDTLPEALREVGYSTHMLGKWHLGYKKDAYLPHEQGFDTWWGLPYSNDYRKPWVQTNEPLAIFKGKTGQPSEMVEHPINQDTLTTRYTKRAVQRIERESGTDEPFFLYLAYNMPHLPIHTTEQFRGQSGAGLYGDVVQTIDWSVGQVTEALKQQGISDQTIVFFASDNGPWLKLPSRMRQAGNQRWHQGTTGALRGSKTTTYEGGGRVPAIIRWPGQIESGVETDEIAASQDIYTTVLAAAGLDKDQQQPNEGMNLLPWLTGDQAHSPRDRYSYVFRNKLEAYREGEWKLRLAGDEPQLFNLQSDPGERFNRAADNPKVVERLRKQMRKRADEINAAMPKSK
jgi:arylsulfatase A-like enzyme